MGVKFSMDPSQKILLKRGLNKNGDAQMFFSKECAKEMDNYVPFQSGRLKNWNLKVAANNITYEAPYAKQQYYANKGTGKQGIHNGGLRGPFWDRRMWSDKGNDVVKSIADFVGGRAR